MLATRTSVLSTIALPIGVFGERQSRAVDDSKRERT